MRTFVFRGQNVKHRFCKCLCIFLTFVFVALSFTSCSELQILFTSAEVALGATYGPSTSELNRLYNQEVTFDQIPLEDQWGIVWQGMFEELPYSIIPGSDKLVVVLSNMGIKITRVTVKNLMDYTFYEIRDGNSLIALADMAMEILEKQDDPTSAVDWAVDLYDQFYYSVYNESKSIYEPYLDSVISYFEKVFSSEDSFSVQFALYYAGKHSEGMFIETARDKVQEASRTNVVFVG